MKCSPPLRRHCLNAAHTGGQVTVSGSDMTGHLDNVYIKLDKSLNSSLSVCFDPLSRLELCLSFLSTVESCINKDQ